MSKGDERTGEWTTKASNRTRRVVHQSELLGPARTKNIGGRGSIGNFAPWDRMNDIAHHEN